MRSEPVGRAQRRAGAARGSQGPELAEQVKALLPDSVIDELLSGAGTEEEIAGPGGLLSRLTRRLVERAMEVERPIISAMSRTKSRLVAPGTRGTAHAARLPSSTAYLTLLLDSLRTDRGPLSELPVAAFTTDETHAIITSR